MMKAAYLVAPQQLDVYQVDNPAIPEDGLLVKVEACGICGSDLRRWTEGPVSSKEPVIAGHEIAGVVVGVGSGIGGFEIGDRLAIAPDIHCGVCYYCLRNMYNLCENLRLLGITPGYNGGFADYLVLTAEILRGGIVDRTPPALSPLQAALAEPLSSVLATQQGVGVSLGDTVVVMGAGPIGCLHVAVARARGARVILSEPSEMRRKIATRFNPELIIDPMSQDLVDEVRRATGGRGADTAICANPIAATHAQAVELVRKRGNVVLFGGLPQASPMTILDGNRIHYNEIQVMGKFSYHPAFHTLALDVIQHGLIQCDDIITHTYSIDEINKAFKTAASGEALKVVIQMA
jgi:L-iditol 2-dehydrogenase